MKQGAVLKVARDVRIPNLPFGHSEELENTLGNMLRNAVVAALQSEVATTRKRCRVTDAKEAATLQLKRVQKQQSVQFKLCVTIPLSRKPFDPRTHATTLAKSVVGCILRDGEMSEGHSRAQQLQALKLLLASLQDVNVTSHCYTDEHAWRVRECKPVFERVFLVPQATGCKEMRRQEVQREVQEDVLHLEAWTLCSQYAWDPQDYDSDIVGAPEPMKAIWFIEQQKVRTTDVFCDADKCFLRIELAKFE
jgi:hypothetical protein